MGVSASQLGEDSIETTCNLMGVVEVVPGHNVRRSSDAFEKLQWMKYEKEGNKYTCDVTIPEIHEQRTSSNV